MRGVDDAAAKSMKKVDINKLKLDDLYVEAPFGGEPGDVVS